MAKIFLTLFTVLLLSSCISDNSINFGGEVHYTDEFGNVIGGADDSEEWLFNTDFSMKATDLFDYELVQCSLVSAITVVKAYPNPATDVIQVGFDIPSTGILDVFIVNGEYETQSSLVGEEISQQSSFSFDISDYEKGQQYRMFYAVQLDDQNCVYKGYGDIEIKN